MSCGLENPSEGCDSRRSNPKRPVRVDESLGNSLAQFIDASLHTSDANTMFMNVESHHTRQLCLTKRELEKRSSFLEQPTINFLLVQEVT
ncbi:hypothetical protein RRG08_062370 [Elysia crispata]|uniref:Uncharacterized protein n=1 Tax=Elysia crispata TaxID=231223 RepID=A0AAE1CYZ2_9GAST|nr:hypothetical protein RRG08_062370 [Elysia crispata]